MERYKKRFNAGTDVLNNTYQKRSIYCMKKSIKRHIFEVIQDQKGGYESVANEIFDIVIMSLIFLSVVSVYVSTFKVPAKVEHIFEVIENVSMVVFIGEYIMRLWTANYLYPECGAVRSRLKYAVSTLAVVDLIAILPALLPMIMPANLLGLRVVRLVRLIRVFKMNRYSESLSFIGDVLKKKSREMVISLAMVFLLLLAASLLIYYAEHEAQPQHFANAFSGLWWAVVTLTTVGYGDIFPVTVCGRILGALIAVMGIGMVAVPTGILSSGFVELLNKKDKEEYEKEKAEKEAGDKEEKKNYCPHCGKKL